MCSKKTFSLHIFWCYNSSSTVVLFCASVVLKAIAWTGQLTRRVVHFYNSAVRSSLLCYDIIGLFPLSFLQRWQSILQQWVPVSGDAFGWSSGQFALDDDRKEDVSGGEGMMILNNRDIFFCFFFLPFCCVTFARLHAVFGHGGGNDLVFCGLKTFGTHFCKRLQIDDLDFLFMRLSWLVASSDAPVLLLCLFMWLPEWIPKQIEEKLAPLLCFCCVNHHIVCMITHQYQICTI